MKNVNTIKIVLCSICFGFISLFARAQQINTYQWSGGSGHWTDLQHWTVAGQPATNLPSGTDRIFISANKTPVVISVNKDVEVESVFTSGAMPIAFRAEQSIDFTVSGSFVLSDLTNVNRTIKIRLKGISANSLLELPTEIDAKVRFGKKSNYKPIDPIVKSGGCPYFTIVPNPTSPTCNGFSNGIASVLEPTDGVGPYTYQWIGGPQTREWHNVGAGTYTVIVIDVGQGMPCNVDVFVNEPGPLTVFSMNTTPPLCADVCNGTAAPIVIGGNGGYTFTWSSGETSATATMLCPVFTLEVQDQEGCIADTTFIFPNTPDTIQFDAIITNVDCFGNANGAIDLTISGGVGAFTPSWTGPNGFVSSSEDISNLEAGSYTISVLDANGCAADSTFTISENPPLTATTSKIDNQCAEGVEGSINIIPAGGSGIYNYVWSGPNAFMSTDQNLINLASGLYEVTITDDAGCVLIKQVSIDEPNPITLTFTSDPILCAGDATGSATATAMGGVPGYTYSWTGPNGFSATGPGISNLFSATYTVSVTDAHSCLKIDSLTISEPDSLHIDVTKTPVSCHNGADGTIEIEPTGGTLPYTVQWSEPGGFVSSDLSLTNLQPGNYIVNVTDGNGCSTSANVDMQNPSLITLDAVVLNGTCATGNTGSIDLTVNGGVSPFDYLWTGPSGFSNTNEDLSNLTTGTYNIAITDAGGCTVSGSFTVSAPDTLSATFVKQNISCFGLLDGSIQTNPAGGVAPYEFLWIGPAGFFTTDQNISSLSAGSYSLQISDANGCAGFFMVTLTQPSKISLGNIPTQVTCFGGSDGAIDLAISGGTPGYTYSWIGPDGFTSTQADIDNLFAGLYTLTVTDNIGCSRSRDFTITQPTQITVDATIEDVACSGDSDGSIAVSVTNGVAPYSYSWTGPNGFASAMEDIDSLVVGEYTLTITDANMCSAVNTFTLNYTTVITTEATILDVTCFSNADGAIDATISGGIEPYQVAWSGPAGFVSNSVDIDSLVAGSYTLSGSDFNGCAFTQNYTVSQPDELIADLTKTDITCAGEVNGSLSANISGGTLPYTVSWIGPDGFASANEDLTNLAAGHYYLTVTDQNSCSTLDSAIIVQPDSIHIEIQITQPSCLIDNGELIATVSGGVVATDYTYFWTNQNGDTVGNTAIISSLPPGEYILNISDDNGCSTSTTIELIRIVFNVAATVQNVSCNGSNDGQIIVTPTSGTPPFSFLWTGPAGFTSTDSILTQLLAGNYILHVEDDAGCEVDLDYDINQPEPISAEAEIIPIGCLGESNGAIQLNPTGGNPNYTITWTGPDGYTATGASISNLTEGVYLASITDASGCSKDTLITLEPGFDFTTTIIPVAPTCFDADNGSIDMQITVLSGIPGNYTFQWTGENGFTSTAEDISNLSAGTYTLLVISDAGCTHQDTVTLVNPEPISLDVSVANSNCLQADGGAGVNISGASSPYSIAWINAANDTLSTQDTLMNVPSGIYTLVVKDALGCEAQDVVTISDSSGSVEGVVSNPICHNGSSGSIDITVDGGTEPFTFEWFDGSSIIATDEDIQNLPAGTYAVMVYDVNGCTYSAEFELENPNPLAVQVDKSGVTCQGGDGEITLTITEGASPYSVSWTGPNGFSATGESIGNLTEGTYQYTVTDANSCSTNGTIEIDLLPSIVLNSTVTYITCGGDSTGAILLSVSSGLPPYSFQWNGANGFTSTNEDISNLSAGDYTVLVTDDLACTVEQTFTVSENPPMVVDFGVINPGCLTNNGSISAAVAGGVATSGYTIQWYNQNGDPISSQDTLTNLGVGIYNFEVTDDVGCGFDTTIVLSNPGVDITAIVGSISCAGDSSGTIDLSFNGVPEPYSAEWTGPNGYIGSGINLTGLKAGEYNYVLTSTDGCAYLGAAVVTQPDSLLATAILSRSCFGDSSGSIDITPVGGVPNYSISWVGPDGFLSNETDLTNLLPGIYTLSLADENNCAFTADYEVVENSEIHLDASISTISCNGDGSGSIEIAISGGQTPYTTSWTGPGAYVSSEDSIFGLVAGDYFLTVTDNTSCSRDTSFSLIEPEAITIDQTVISAGCTAVGSPGYIALNVSGGTPAYTIDWTGPNGFIDSTLVIDNLDSGMYTYFITDAVGCQYSDSIEIMDVAPLSLELYGTNPSCHNTSDGSALAVITGGMEPYQYSWVGPEGFASSNAEINNLIAGSYTLILADSAGCTNAANLEIVAPDSISILLDNYTDATCNSSNDASISPEVSGGAQPYSYFWVGPAGFESSDSALSNIPYGTYSLTVTDASGCSNTAEVSIGYLFEIVANAGADQIICTSDLPLVIHGNSANSNQYIWTNLAGDTLAHDSVLTLMSNPEPGTLSFVFTAGNGLCTTQDTVQITILENPVVDAGKDQEVFAEAQFTLGGNPTSVTGISYLWYPAANGAFDNEAANPIGNILESTTFVVRVTDANGCVGTDSTRVIIIPEVAVTSGFTPNGDGVNDTWIIDNMELFPTNVVQIFNRWGLILYTKTGYNAENAWDGMYNGEPVPIGTYYFAIDLNDSRFPDPLTGPITIYR